MDRAGSSHLFRQRARAAGAACSLVVALLVVFTGPALAGPESGVDVVVHDGDTETVAGGDTPTACTFHLHFQADAAVTGAFQIRAGDEDGKVIEDGEFDTASGDSRAPATGVFELDPGTYTVTWDDELEVDRSFDEQAITVACEAPVDSGGGEVPVESGGEELPAESGGEELPAGGVGGITTTPPPTDASPSVTGRQSDLRPTLAFLVGIGGLGLFLARRQTRSAHLGRETVTHR